MNLNEAINRIKPTCEKSRQKAAEKWDTVAKPLRSLGALESTVSKIAGILRTEDVIIDKRCVVVMCADNGVVAQNITQADAIITSIMADNFAKGTTTVCTMAQFIQCDVIPVDIGINSSVSANGLIDKKIMYGTKDLSMEPAMSRDQAIRAIEVGIEMAETLHEKGYTLIATGEMGIGNTTTSSAIASVLLDKPAEGMTGRGAGLDDEGLKRKIKAIKKGIELHKPNAKDPIDVLAKVGGLDIAGMAGLCIGCAALSIPVLLDGFISGVAALIAIRLCPICAEYMIPSHLSAEPAAGIIMDHLGFSPMIRAGMCLGEGTGAMAALGLIDMAVYTYKHTITFRELDIEAYVHFKL